MTYKELITERHGDNLLTGQLIGGIIDNSCDLIGNLVNLLTDEDIASLRVSLNTSVGRLKLFELVTWFYTELDVLTVPIDSNTPLLSRVGGLLAAALKPNVQLLKGDNADAETV